MARADQQRIYNVLKDFRGLDSLRRLFWQELNYDRANEALSRRTWPERRQALLAEDPVLFARAGDEGDFHLIYCRLASDRLSLSDERELINRLHQDHPHALFIFSDQQGRHWHLVNVKQGTRHRGQMLFRRIALGPGEQVRTASERIALLDPEPLQQSRSGVSALAVQERHDDAFDVEAVTKKFFEEYRKVFEAVEGAIRGLRDADRKRLFVQRLFNRLMFLAFVQKKGWLRYPGAGEETPYLEALWKAYAKTSGSATSFYRDRLQPLFFKGLNTQQKDAALQALIGEVPYLNGGLFEEDAEDRNAAVVVPDEAIGAILHDLFGRFNFTVTESTPLDVEVAVDPEMLGKIFEELVTGRHETGSYYTPKPVVSFMCREALKGYLATAMPYEKPEAIARFVDEQEPHDLKDPERTLNALRAITVCDPACGSGAYLLGMLHELLELRASLFSARSVDQRSVYERKLEIIQQNVYGVDIDPFAVNIARLRLWLSLAVDYEGQNPPPLPNLDLKVEVGDSLTAPNPEKTGQIRDELIRRYLETKRLYMTAHGDVKRSLIREISDLRGDISTWTHGGRAVHGFDWPVEYAEVFDCGGFDIVLANPPYVRADAQYKHLSSTPDKQRQAISEWKVYRSELASSGIYQTLFEKWDLYIPFLERAFQILRSGGQMVFIISDAYNFAKYAQKSHLFFLSNATIDRIDFCTDIPLFNAGVTNTILHFSKRPAPQHHVPVRMCRWGVDAQEFVEHCEQLPSQEQSETGEQIFKLSSEPVPQVSCKTVRLGDICYISTGLRPWLSSALVGRATAFTTDDLVQDTPDRLHPKRWVESKDTAKWKVQRVRFLEWGTSRAPGQFESATFPEFYEAPEKLLTKDIAASNLAVAYDADGCLPSHTAYCCVPWHYLSGVRNRALAKTAKYEDQLKPGEERPRVLREEVEQISRRFDAKYLLAVMNSTFAKQWIASNPRSKLHVYPDDWKDLPIAEATREEQTQIVALVNQVLEECSRTSSSDADLASSKLAKLEADLDNAVAHLYNGSAS